jgi:hypothetical protein
MPFFFIIYWKEFLSINYEEKKIQKILKFGLVVVVVLDLNTSDVLLL